MGQVQALVRVVEQAGQGVGQGVGVARGDQAGGVAQDLLQGAAVAWPPPGCRRPWRAAGARPNPS